MHFIRNQTSGFSEMTENNEKMHMGGIASKPRIVEGDRHDHYLQYSYHFIGHICQNLWNVHM